MNSDWERYGDVIEKYDQEYLAGCNKYPTTLHGAYILLKNWSQKPAKKGPGFNKLGLSFNTLGDNDEKNGNAFINDGKDNKPTCPRCGQTNHTLEQCCAKYAQDGTLLHMIGAIEEAGYEVSTDSTNPEPPLEFIFDCGDELEEIMFLQPHETNSWVSQQNMSSRKGIPTT